MLFHLCYAIKFYVNWCDWIHKFIECSGNFVLWICLFSSQGTVIHSHCRYCALYPTFVKSYALHYLVDYCVVMSCWREGCLDILLCELINGVLLLWRSAVQLHMECDWDRTCFCFVYGCSCLLVVQLPCIYLRCRNQMYYGAI